MTKAGIPNWAPARAYTRGMVRFVASGANAYTYGKTAGLWQVNLLEDGMYDDFTPLLIGAVQKPYGSGSYYANVNVPANLLNRVKTELLTKVAKQDLNLGNNLVEMNKTVKMVSSRLLQLLRAYRAAKRLRVREFFSILGLSPSGGKSARDASSLWLEGIYGWLPLAKDIYAGAQLMEEGFKETNGMLLRAVRQISEGVPMPDVSKLPGKPKSISGTRSLSLRGQAYWRISDLSLRQYQRVGLTNPAQWAWEALPFSFLIDWVMPVGNYLQALTATQGLTFVDGCISIQLRDNLKLIDFMTVPTPGAVIKSWVARDLTVSIDALVFKRVPISNPAPALYVKSPFSATHVANALALLHQLGGRR